MEQDFNKKLKSLQEQQERLKYEMEVELQKALRSEDPDSLMKANQYIQKLKQRQASENQKSFVFDPFEVAPNAGFRQDNFNISPGLLRSMGKTPYARTVISTRLNQIAEFLEPKSDSTTPCWYIRKKPKNYYSKDKDKKVSEEDEKRINECTEFLLNCGKTQQDSWSNDTTLHQFVMKIMKDSLELDRMAAEVIEEDGGDVAEFLAVDASTIFYSDWYSSNSIYSDKEREEAELDGFLPSHVQLLQNEIVCDYYPWELMWGVRNPSTELRRNGYGYPELASLVDTITSLLNADQYNSNFFKIGSAPKGILSVKGGVSKTALEDFKYQWRSEMSGVLNAHKLPILRAESAEWINTNVPNKDMEFSEYYQFMVRLLCVLFKMSPSEAGLDKGGNNMFNSENTKEEYNYSRNKGLKPLLKFLQRKINKWLVQRGQYSDLEFLFSGLEPDTEEKEAELNMKRVQYLETYNEMAERTGVKTQPWGDIPLNPVALQAMQGQQQGGEGSNQFVDEEEGQPVDEGMDLGDLDFNLDFGQYEDLGKSNKDQDPITKSFTQYLEHLKEKYEI